MSVYITGDCHGEFSRFDYNFYDNDQLTKDDVVIICGDFGGVWQTKDIPYTYPIDEYVEVDKKHLNQENVKLDLLDEYPWTTVFVDGNHEQHHRLNTEFPIKEWNGGLVHEIRPSVLHLMRGEIYNIEDKKFWCFGGAASHDISDGIIDPATDKHWENTADDWWRQGRLYRIKDLSWWEEELPSEAEMDNGIYNLMANDWKVDYLITHSPSASEAVLMGFINGEPDRLMKYLDDIKSKTDYRRHYCGHMHCNKPINDKDICLYWNIERIL